MLKSKTKDLQNPQDKPAIEPKKSFREVFLEGEVQSLRAQVIELHSLRAQASELPYLQARLEKQQLSLRAAETREYEQVGVLFHDFNFYHLTALNLVC